MLDVGQGDAFLIQSNSKTILVDTGQSEQKLFAALSRQGCTHLDAVIITHADNDHAGCLSALKGVVDCESVILSEGTNIDTVILLRKFSTYYLQLIQPCIVLITMVMLYVVLPIKKLK